MQAEGEPDDARKVILLMRAILFDLDGTLLDLDIDHFMSRYVAALAAEFASILEPERFREALMAGTFAMIQNDGSTTNEDAFWTMFEKRTGLERAPLLPLTDRFYREVFPTLADIARPVEAAPRVVAAAKESGAVVVLATNAIFPETAIAERLRWAGIDPALFDLLTSYETMHASKPNPAYYREICRKVGVAPQEALMIGNDPELDVRAAQAAGLRTYLVEDVTRVSTMEEQLAKGAPSAGSRAPVTPDGRGSLAGAATFIRERFAQSR